MAGGTGVAWLLDTLQACLTLRPAVPSWRGVYCLVQFSAGLTDCHDYMHGTPAIAVGCLKERSPCLVQFHGHVANVMRCMQCCTLTAKNCTKMQCFLSAGLKKSATC